MTKARRCQSKSQFGDCGLPARHKGDHSVPIGPPHFYFDYTRNRPARPVGYLNHPDRPLGENGYPALTVWVCSDCDYEKPGDKDSPEADEHNETTGHELRWDASRP